MAADRPLVKQFDKDGNGRLELAERNAAREWMATQPLTGIPAMMDFMARGMPGGRAGMAAMMTAGRGFAPSGPGRRVVQSDVRAAPASAPFYDTGTLRTLFFQFENPGWQKELEAFYRTDVDVPATLSVDGRTYRDVGVRFRGMSSYMMTPEGSKRSLNVTVDFAREDQRLMGYRTLNLLNVNGDATFARPLLYSEIAQKYLPAAKANYVRVVINNEDWGVYVNVEQFNADFIQARFGTRRGARWKVPGSPFGQGGMAYLGDDAEKYKFIYEIKSNDNPGSWRALIAMFKLLNETPLEQLEAALAPVMDVDGVLKFLALEIALVNTDGYWTRASDYNLYQDVRGRFHVIPHDVNEAFEEENFGGGPGRGFPPGMAPPGFPPQGGAPGAGAPGGPPPGFPPLPPGMAFPANFGRATVELDPLVGLDDASKPLRSRLLAVPSLRARYLGYVRDIADKWLDWRTLEPMVRRYQALIAESVKADTKKLYSFEAFQSNVATGDDSLRGFAERRRAFLLKTVNP
jgi:spore coat protein CotH